MCMYRQGCSLSMLHRTCEKLHWGVRLGGLSMPKYCNEVLNLNLSEGNLCMQLIHVLFLFIL